MFDVRDQILNKHSSLFHGRPTPVWTDVPDGWLALLDFTLDQMWWGLSPKERAAVRITHVIGEHGALVVRGAYPVKCEDLLIAMRDASAGLCVCCGQYAVSWAVLPLCRVCTG